MRNYQEHPDAKRPVVDNFALLPNGTISLPMWHLAGEAPRPVAAEMRTRQRSS